jgi:hypothetical protein
MRRASEPHVANAAVVARQVLKRTKPIEMIYRNGSNSFWRCEPQIYCDATTPLVVELECAPAEHATALRAEMYFQGWVCFTDTRIADARSGNGDTFTLIVVGPQRSVAAAQGTAACRRSAGVANQRPTAITAVARAFEHCSQSTALRLAAVQACHAVVHHDHRSGAALVAQLRAIRKV